jgi:hypothetical protein
MGSSKTKAGRNERPRPARASHPFTGVAEPAFGPKAGHFSGRPRDGQAVLASFVLGRLKVRFGAVGFGDLAATSGMRRLRFA